MHRLEQENRGGRERGNGMDGGFDMFRVSFDVTDGRYLDSLEHLGKNKNKKQAIGESKPPLPTKTSGRTSLLT